MVSLSWDSTLLCLIATPPHIWLNSPTYQNVHALATIDIFQTSLLVMGFARNSGLLPFSCSLFTNSPRHGIHPLSGFAPYQMVLKLVTVVTTPCSLQLLKVMCNIHFSANLRKYFFMPDVWEVALVTTDHSLNRLSLGFNFSA